MNDLRVQSAKRALLAIVAAIAIVGFQGATALAESSASVLPPEWHIHDGQTLLGAQHKGIGFFPRILGTSTATYLLDPASCPNATDKSLLPSSGNSNGAVIRAGVCFTSTAVIQLRTVPVGVSGPDGWASILTEGGTNRTYYQVTLR